ncbi:MAG: glycosyltransferase family 4 protein, partial [Nitrospiria bacterium]
PPGGWLIGTVARLVTQKALHVLLEGYARYRECATCPSRLVLVGTGPLREALEAQTVSLGIADSVMWAGFREDIPTVHAAIDLFVLTSAYEGFGLVLLEAMAAARPVLATRVSAIPEVVADGITGRLVDAGAPEQIAAGIKEFEDADRRRAFGEAGRQRAGKVFGLEQMIDRTIGVYRNCVDLQTRTPDPSLLIKRN